MFAKHTSPMRMQLANAKIKSPWQFLPSTHRQSRILPRPSLGNRVIALLPVAVWRIYFLWRFEWFIFPEKYELSTFLVHLNDLIYLRNSNVRPFPENFELQPFLWDLSDLLFMTICNDLPYLRNFIYWLSCGIWIVGFVPMVLNDRSCNLPWEKYIVQIPQWPVGGLNGRGRLAHFGSCVVPGIANQVEILNNGILKLMLFRFCSTYLAAEWNYVS
jgi:hypothetical protein